MSRIEYEVTRSVEAKPQVFRDRPGSDPAQPTPWEMAKLYATNLSVEQVYPVYIDCYAKAKGERTLLPIYYTVSHGKLERHMLKTYQQRSRETGRLLWGIS